MSTAPLYTVSDQSTEHSPFAFPHCLFYKPPHAPPPPPNVSILTPQQQDPPAPAAEAGPCELRWSELRRSQQRYDGRNSCYRPPRTNQLTGNGPSSSTPPLKPTSLSVCVSVSFCLTLCISLSFSINLSPALSHTSSIARPRPTSSDIRGRPIPRSSTLQGNLAHKKTPPPLEPP